MNKLPEKLSLLRKNCGLPQNEIAQRLMVPVSEYMNWENGNSIPDIDKLQKIAELYHIDLVALIDNTMTFVAPPMPSIEKSATIPFQYGSNSLVETQQLTSVSALSTGDTKEADFGKTKVMDTTSIQKNSKEEEDDDDYEEEPIRRKKPSKPVKKKNTILLLTGSIATVIVLALILIFINRSTTHTNLTMNNTNRLALTPTYSMYLQNDGTLKTRGANYPTDSAFKDFVQIAARDSVAIGLKKDGTVHVANSSLDTADWINVKEIAAGNHHAAALLSDGSVKCVGSENACNVSDWENVSHIYAGNDVTIALTESGTFLSSGGVSIPSVTGAKDVTVSNTAMYYINANNGVSGVGLNGASILSTTSLTNVTALAAGDNFLAALLKDGTVKLVSDNQDDVKQVEQWKKVKYIAANGNTLIAITDSQQMYGIGDNTYNQYENTVAAAPTPTPTATAEPQLSPVTNVTFTETTEDVQISWDTVTNADFYEVTIGSINYAVNSMSASASIPASSLNSGSTYTVTITAKSNDADKYPDSKPTTINYTYSQKTTQLDTPGSLYAELDGSNNWVISWGGVPNASYYTLYINEEVVETISGTSYTISGSNLQNGANYTISVKAISNDSKYTESGIARLSQVYTRNEPDPEPEVPVEPDPETPVEDPQETGE